MKDVSSGRTKLKTYEFLSALITYSKPMIPKKMVPSVFIVCSARALSNGWKSRVSPNSGNYIAKGKGVHRELESERSRRQTSDLTDRNFI